MPSGHRYASERSGSRTYRVPSGVETADRYADRETHCAERPECFQPAGTAERSGGAHCQVD